MSRKIKPKNLSIIIFPYFFIFDKEGIQIDGINIKSSYTENIEKEKKEVKEQLLRIAKLFRFGRDKQIFQWSYFITYLSSVSEWKSIEERLNKFVNVIRYIGLRDLKEHAKFGQFNYFLFELTTHQLEKNKNHYFYSGILNGQSTYNFQLNKGKVQNPFVPSDEIHPQIMSKNQVIQNDYFIALYQFSNKLFKDGEDKKILRSLEWFNRSFSHYGRGVDLSEAIINIHSALEALLRPADEERGVKSQLKTALTNLLGNSRELNNWFDSFWKLRNSIVHGDIYPGSFMYIHPESKNKKGHRHHLYLARKIYVKCLEAILKTRSDFPLLGFEEELVSNEVRVNRVIKLLKQKGKSVGKLYSLGVFETISALRNDDISIGKNETRKLGGLFLPILKSDIETNEKTKTEIIKKIKEILMWKGNNLGDLALIYSDLEQLFSSVYFSTAPSKIEYLALRGAAYNFLGFATWRLLTLYE